MTPFLKQVAAHYLAAPDIQKRCFIFPNRRSLVFFKKYLGDLLVGAPLPVPPLYTINAFFYKVADAHASDRLRLLLELYKCYTSLNPQAESLDDFLFWGEVLLADFDDVDKYLVDAAGLMQNVGDFKAIYKARHDFRKWRHSFDDERGKIQQQRVSPEAGRLAPFAILWHYYVRRHIHFDQLPPIGE